METWGEAQAEAYISGLYDVLKLLALNPAMGRPRRELARDLHGFRYREHTIFYVTFDDGILVIRVLNARRLLRPGLLR